MEASLLALAKSIYHVNTFLCCKKALIKKKRKDILTILEQYPVTVNPFFTF